MGLLQERGYEGFEYPPETKCDIFQAEVEQIIRAIRWPDFSLRYRDSMEK